MLISSHKEFHGNQQFKQISSSKELKQMIFNMDANLIISLFKHLEMELKINSIKEYTKNGLRCTQCQIKFDQFKSKGYGRDEPESLINSIKNLLEMMFNSNYMIESIKNILKYILQLKNRQPLIQQPSSQKSGSISRKSTTRKTQLVTNNENLKYDKKSLDDEFNKENISLRMNQRKDLNESKIQLTNDKRMIINANEIKVNVMGGKIKTQQDNPKQDQQGPKHTNMKKINPIEPNCINHKNETCIYYEIQNHSQNQIRSLNARIKLLEQQNSVLKQLLLKDFNQQFFKPLKQ